MYQQQLHLTEWTMHHWHKSLKVNVTLQIWCSIQHCLYKPDLRPEVLYNLESGSWLAWANDTTVYYVGLLTQQTTRQKKQCYFTWVHN